MTTAFIACRAMKMRTVTLRMIHDAILIVLLWSKSFIVFLAGGVILGIIMVGGREMLNAQKTDPKRNRRKERKETMKKLGNGTSSRCEHDEESDPGVNVNVVKRRERARPLRLMGDSNRDCGDEAVQTLPLVQHSAPKTVAETNTPRIPQYHIFDPSH